MNNAIKNIRIIIACLLLSSCNSVKHKFGKEKFELTNISIYTKNMDEYEKDKSIILFTYYYDKDSIKIINGSKLIGDEIIETIPQVGLAASYTIINKYPTYVYIGKVKIQLKDKELKNYKYIYIEKSENGKNITVDYSNIRRSFQ